MNPCFSGSSDPIKHNWLRKHEHACMVNTLHTVISTVNDELAYASFGVLPGCVASSPLMIE